VNVLGSDGRARVVARVIGASVEGERVLIEGLRVSTPRALALFVVELVSGVVLLAVSARVVFRIPGVLVPFTLQTLALTLVTLLYGRRAWRVVAAYVAAGLLGLPVFALGGGPGYIASPTFGYLLGFILASYLAGRIARPATPKRFMEAALAIPPLVYLPGALWLALWLTLTAHYSPASAIHYATTYGILIFIPWDLLKAASGSLIAYKTFQKLYAINHKTGKG
jgi:biotin transport system substrate-specific component